jgi:hypothetical protein
LRAGKEALGTRKVKIPPQTHGKTPWFCDRIASLAGEKREAFINLKSLRTPNPYNIYKGIRNDVNANIRQIKREFWESYTKSMERDFYGQQNRIWRMIQNQKRDHYLRTKRPGHEVNRDILVFPPCVEGTMTPRNMASHDAPS